MIGSGKLIDRLILVMRSPRTRFYISPDGSFNVRILGSFYSPWQDLYHFLLNMPWWGIMIMVFLLYIVTNCLFAVAYLIGGDNINNATPGAFRDAFFFSIQTISTIGYGAMSPKTLYADILVAIEALIGLLGVAMVMGLMFARFSRPTARVLFSKVAVIAPHNGVPTLMFRAANERMNRIIEAKMQLSLLRDEVTLEGQYIRRIYDLKLLRNSSAAFILGWLVMHPIDEHSPLQGLTRDDLFNMNASIIATMTGLDETLSQTIHARHGYSPDALVWNSQFVDLFTLGHDGQRYLDYRRFHEVIACEDG